MLSWSPTGKPVVPKGETQLRQQQLRPFDAQHVASLGHPPGSEIRRSNVRKRREVSIRSYAFRHGQGRGLLRRRMNVTTRQGRMGDCKEEVVPRSRCLSNVLAGVLNRGSDVNSIYGGEK
jgi:hypothetical protein